MNIAVTGGAGFIGHHLVWHLLDCGHQVHVFDNFSTGEMERLVLTDERTNEVRLPEGLTLYQMDIVNQPMPPIDCDVLVHLAAPISVQESLENPEEYHKGIVEGSKRVFNWARGMGVKHIVAASTAAVYGDNEDVPLDEDVTPRPMSPYAKYKLEMEEILSTYNTKDLNCVALRFFNVYGEGQNDGSKGGGYVSAIPIFLRQYNHYEPITVTGDGLQTRDFIHVLDVCRAICLAFEQGWQVDMPIYNVGSGKEWQVIQIAKTLGGEIKYVEARQEPRRSLAEIGSIRRELGWEPEIDLISWLRAQK